MRRSTRWVMASIMLGFTGLAGHAAAKSPTVTVQTEYLGTVDIPLAAPYPVGSRLIFNIPAGGTIHGPKINGTFMQPAGDWLNLMPDGSFHLDVREMVKTDDGALILVEANGVIAPAKEAMDRLAKGGKIDSTDEYFMLTPRFSTASKPYDWLNKVQAVGKMVSLKRDRLVYDFFVLH